MATSASAARAASRPRPRWVKLVRSGSLISGFESPDGVTWTAVGSDTFTMGANVLVGLAVSSHVTGVNATATFDNVTVTVASPAAAGQRAADAALTSPASGASCTAPATVNLAASASDSDGTIDEGRLLLRIDAARNRHVRAVRDDVEQRRGRDLQPDRRRDRRRRSDDLVGGDHRHGGGSASAFERRAVRVDDESRRRRVVHRSGHRQSRRVGERQRRHYRQGGLLQRVHAARDRHVRALRRDLEQRRDRHLQPDGGGHRQLRRSDSVGGGAITVGSDRRPRRHRLRSTVRLDEG